MLRIVAVVALFGLASCANLRADPAAEPKALEPSDRPKAGEQMELPKYRPALTGDINGEDDNEEGLEPETKVPETANFYKPQTKSAPVVEPEAAASYVPKYSTEPLSQAVHAVVTKGFCAHVLKAMKEKQAPYFIHDEFTGEARHDLVEQCGVTICNWGLEYKKLVPQCDGCPKDCQGDMSGFFDQLLKDPEASAPIIKAILHQAGTKKTKTVNIKLEKAPVDPEGEPPKEEGYPLPAVEGEKDEGMDGDGATAKFCKDVLAGIKAQAAPYFIDGKYTGESRTMLVDQCGEKVCGWAGVASAVSSGPACTKYLDDLMKEKPTAAKKLAHGWTGMKNGEPTRAAKEEAPAKEEAKKEAPAKEEAKKEAPAK